MQPHGFSYQSYNIALHAYTCQTQLGACLEEYKL